MSDFNRVILIGRIGNELELKRSAQDKAYLKISLATNFQRSGEERTTHWHRVMVFGHTAEVCATYLRKGAQIMVEGHLEVRTYTNAEGRKTSSVSVIGNNVRFLDGAKRNETGDPASEFARAEAAASGHRPDGQSYEEELAATG